MFFILHSSGLPLSKSPTDKGSKSFAHFDFHVPMLLSSQINSFFMVVIFRKLNQKINVKLNKEDKEENSSFLHAGNFSWSNQKREKGRQKEEMPV